jgi:aminomethyltransferase
MIQKSTVLLDAHRRHGAKLIDFAGWDMPLQYDGVIAEHKAVRESCGVFDVSHLGKLTVSGRVHGEALGRAVTADVMSLEIGRATYALALTDEGTCIDDIFVYRIDEAEWMVVPNASNVDAVADSIRGCGGEVVDDWNRYSILALQGPLSYEVYEATFPGTQATELKLHGWMYLDVFGEKGIVARTGYTGERGFELYVPVAVSDRAFEALVSNGAKPAGLGARDTLRLEMGYALYGHEIDLETTPLEAGLGWVLNWDVPFRGRDALQKVKDDGVARRLFAIVCRDRGVPRQGYEVVSEERVIGTVTSGNHSPTLGTGIALARGPVETLPKAGDQVAIQARGRLLRGDIVKPPFVKKR